MPVLVTSKFDEDTIKTERASLETPFFHFKSGNFFRRSMAPNSEGQNLNSSELLCLSLLPASLMKIGSKLKA